MPTDGWMVQLGASCLPAWLSCRLPVGPTDGRTDGGRKEGTTDRQTEQYSCTYKKSYH